ncbi:MAG TPA: protein phosphatase 2C domain-containing protein, partial [Solirubrobacteraceae bacterium]|nr:protein phosphatase 2C domain-containing protein [Solirubrobacteraceae bacterium]
MSALTMQAAAWTEVGRRANNEDSVFCSPRLVAVADGVGGAAAGEVASRCAINEMISLEASRLTSALDVAVHGALQKANSALSFLVECRPEWAGMATTLTAVALSNDGDYVIANVGDSRTYLSRDGELRQLTRDQSLVQELIDRGSITREQARGHPQRSVVLESLDGNEHAIGAPALHRARLGDRLLLCSDGISDYLTDDQIAVALRTRSPQDAAQQLVAMALDAGSRDNVSAVVA